ncbi:MAG TPA: trigger factor [Phycisphaerales bacterium]|nr:trigger factor [Phycisphaerales bacterium]
MATATQERQNVVKLADAGPSCKKLSIEIPAETVSEKLKESLDTLAVEAELPGFRKGRVPRWLIEKRFLPTLRKEAKSELVTSAVGRAIDDLKLKLVGNPGGGNLDKVEIEDGKPFAFEVEVEVLPEFDLPSLEGIAVKKPIIEITDEMVTEELKKFQINEGSLESRDSAEPGDYVTGHAVMTGTDGTEFYNLKGAVIQVPPPEKNGKGMILGIMVDNFSKQLGALKPGATATIKAKGPEQHEVEKIRNADLTITFTADRVDRIIPASMEHIINGFGVADEAALREFIKSRMGMRVQVQQQGAMHSQIAKHLIDNVKIDLPQRMTAQQAGRTLERRRLELMYRGVDSSKIEEHMAELRTASNQAAARDLALFFILHKAGEELKIRVDDAEINARIAQMAFQRNVRPEQLRQELIKTNQVGGVYQQIRDHKTLDAILAKATVTEMPAEEYNKSVKEAEAKV